jgi:uncharacterized membrane protein
MGVEGVAQRRWPPARPDRRRLITATGRGCRLALPTKDLLMSVIKYYLAIAVPLLIADGVWLGLIAKRFYREALGALMANPVKIVPAAIFYLAYPVGLLIFAVWPANTMSHTALLGSLFGLFCYGTYDLVNHATIRGWPLRLTLVDMAWGTTISALAAIVPWLLFK